MTSTQKMFPLLERKTSAQDVFCLPMAGAHIYVDKCLTKERRFSKFHENVSVHFILRNHIGYMFSSYLVYYGLLLDTKGWREETVKPPGTQIWVPHSIQIDLCPIERLWLNFSECGIDVVVVVALVKVVLMLTFTTSILLINSFFTTSLPDRRIMG